MDIISEVSDTLGALIADRGVEDPTFQRMLKVYQDVSELLGRRRDFDQIVTGLLTEPKTRYTLRETPSYEHAGRGTDEAVALRGIPSIALSAS